MTALNKTFTGHGWPGSCYWLEAPRQVMINLARWDLELQSLRASLQTLEEGILPDEDVTEARVSEAGEDRESSLEPEVYLRGQRRWKKSKTVAIPEKIQRSLAREANLVKVQQRLLAEVTKFERVAELAADKIADKNARIKDILS